MSRLEKKLDLIIESNNLKWHDEGLEEVKKLLRSGQKIPAVKLYRENTGTGLLEAKKAIEEMEAEL
ncbi:MAG: hypothetical protein ABGX16_24560 [Pirellulales bacterium]